MYYLYAIRGTWSPVVKIGYYVADILELRKRYVTAYGPHLDVRVFQVPNKQYARYIEKAIHATLIKAGHHIGGELFKAECLDLFATKGMSLCCSYVTRTPSRQQQRLQLQRAETKRQKLAAAAEAALAKSQHDNKKLEDALDNCIANDCSLHPQASTTAAALLRAIRSSTRLPVRQKTLKELMAARNFRFVTKNSVYRGLALDEQL